MCNMAAKLQPSHIFQAMKKVENIKNQKNTHLLFKDYFRSLWQHCYLSLLTEFNHMDISSFRKGGEMYYFVGLPCAKL